MTTHAIKIKAECIACGHIIKLNQKPKIGQIVTCNMCDTQLEIVSVNPVILDWPLYDEDERVDNFDEDDEDYEDFDDF